MVQEAVECYVCLEEIKGGRQTHAYANAAPFTSTSNANSEL